MDGSFLVPVISGPPPVRGHQCGVWVLAALDVVGTKVTSADDHGTCRGGPRCS